MKTELYCCTQTLLQEIKLREASLEKMYNPTSRYLSLKIDCH